MFYILLYIFVCVFNLGIYFIAIQQFPVRPNELSVGYGKFNTNFKLGLEKFLNSEFFPIYSVFLRRPESVTNTIDL